MNMKPKHIILVLIAAILLQQADAQITVKDLRCEMLTNPLGIDVKTPRLSWQIDARGTRDVMQTAWHILVASSPEKLAKNEGDIWNSGKFNSSQSVLVSYM